MNPGAGEQQYCGQQAKGQENENWDTKKRCRDVQVRHPSFTSVIINFSEQVKENQVVSNIQHGMKTFRTFVNLFGFIGLFALGVGQSLLAVIEIRLVPHMCPESRHSEQLKNHKIK